MELLLLAMKIKHWNVISVILRIKCQIWEFVLSAPRYLAEMYALPHGLMAKKHKPCDMSGDDKFYKQGGITNGGGWYSVTKGLYRFIYLLFFFFDWVPPYVLKNISFIWGCPAVGWNESQRGQTGLELSSGDGNLFAGFHFFVCRNPIQKWVTTRSFKICFCK